MILVISPKTSYAAERLKEEGVGLREDLEVICVDELALVNFEIDIGKYSALYIRNIFSESSPEYLPKVAELARQFKQAGKKVVDSAIAEGDLALGKWEDYKKLQAAGIPIPKTEMFNLPSSIFSHPYILKWIYGMKGHGTFLISREEDIKKIPLDIPKEELMLQEFIEADYEYKFVCVGYKSLPVVLKFSMNKLFRPDFENYEVLNTLGSVIPNAAEESLKYEKYNTKGSLHSSAALLGRDDTTNEVVKLAEQASKVLGRELSKVDILEKDGKLYVLEVNRFPGLKSFEELTGFNAFKEFLEYLKK